ncbi:MAG: aminoglycoside phosphotransferase family protein [Prochlorococcaceae cyanobacterium]
MAQARAESDSDVEAIEAIAARFQPAGAVLGVSPLGNGNINDTYLVELSGPGERHAVLQRLNTQVFRQPQEVLANIAAVAKHVQNRLAAGVPELGGRCWQMPRLLCDRASGQNWVEHNGEIWRSLSFVENASCHERLNDPNLAREVGIGLGLFHLLIHDLPAAQLADTLEGFHVTPTVVARYHQQLAASEVVSCERSRWCQSFIAEREAFASVLEDALGRGELQLRPIHGDPKLNNLLFDAPSGQAIALVDLDTIKPGLLHYDIGDCLRSACNPAGEESRDLNAVRFDLGLAEAILRGYLGVASGFMSDADYRYIVASARLISFELGVRFFSDHLAGDVYFRTSHPGHNLERAMVQFRLTESIEAQAEALEAIVQQCRPKAP